MNKGHISSRVRQLVADKFVKLNPAPPTRAERGAWLDLPWKVLVEDEYCGVVVDRSDNYVSHGLDAHMKEDMLVLKTIAAAPSALEMLEIILNNPDIPLRAHVESEITVILKNAGWK